MGLLVTPKTKDYLRSNTIKNYSGVGIDNGMFSSAGKEKFTWEEYERMAKIAMAQVHTGDLGSIYFMVCPDEPMDWGKTYSKAVSEGGLKRIHSWGVPVAIVLQGKRGDPDMATPTNVPWGLVSSIFIGGDDWYKESGAAEACVKKAKQLGKQVHMGRVNTMERMDLASKWGVDSADGTYLMFELAKNAQRIREDNPKKPHESDGDWNKRVIDIMYNDPDNEQDVASDPFIWTYKNLWRDRCRIAQTYIDRHGDLPLTHLAQMELRHDIPKPFTGDGREEDILEYEHGKVKVRNGKIQIKAKHHVRDMKIPRRDWGLQGEPKIGELRSKGILPQ